MAVWTTKSRSELGGGLVLAPERYDPRRANPLSSDVTREGVTLESIAVLVRHIVNAASLEVKSCLVLDTSHAKEGVIVGPYNFLEGHCLGSAKKMIAPNQVIISRLRPYLRQIAFVDANLKGRHPNVDLVCSTEFFVLETNNEQSIAFLVPFLLCEPVQTMLAASQEGGHHPRFSEQTLLNLHVPLALVETRDQVSHNVESTVKTYREYERNIALFKEAAGRAYIKSLK